MADVVQSFDSGLHAGAGMLGQGMQIGLQQQRLRMEQALMPLKMQQAQQEMQATALQLEKAQLDKSAKLKRDAAETELMHKYDSGFDYTNPKEQKSFMQFLITHPEIADSPVTKTVVGLFEKSNQLENALILQNMKDNERERYFGLMGQIAQLKGDQAMQKLFFEQELTKYKQEQMNLRNTERIAGTVANTAANQVGASKRAIETQKAISNRAGILKDIEGIENKYKTSIDSISKARDAEINLVKGSTKMKDPEKNVLVKGAASKAARLINDLNAERQKELSAKTQELKGYDQQLDQYGNEPNQGGKVMEFDDNGNQIK